MKLSDEEEQYFDDVCSKYINNEKFLSMKDYFQHGKVTTYQHVLNVAKESYKMALFLKKNKVNIDIDTVIVGGLLHDFYLYDWHIFKTEKLHGFSHPEVACQNAIKEFNIDKKTQNLIRRHMWPLNIRLIPNTAEARIVSFCDKKISLIETLFERR